MEAESVSAGFMMRPIKALTSRMAIGSLQPLSNSKVAEIRELRRTPLLRNSEQWYLISPDERCLRIGRADNGGHQYAQFPVDIEKKGGEDAEQGDGGNHAPSGQNGGRLEGEAETVEFGTQAAVEQDDGQSELADHVGEGEVVEFDAAQTFLARQHADDEENQQQGHAETRGNARCDDTDEQQQGDDEEESVERVQSSRLS